MPRNRASDTRRTVYITCPCCRAKVRLAVDEAPAKRALNWDEINWSMATSKIADFLGVSRATVSVARRRLAPETIAKANPQKKYDWKNVDWRMTTREISGVLGAPESYVSLMRRSHAPGTVNRRCR